ncbi:MAG: crotonase/enoyl-CoA hydratase family protein [Deltaproteobacteria bacterium]|nr:crotonase/enoyl-CoA hydratase family protein [Deltaproteobacteria bacterium]
MSNDAVRYELRGSVAVLQMDDGKANALSHSLIDELLAALDRAEKEATAVLLTGRPGKLCAGFDLRTMMSGVQAARDLVTHGAEMYLRLYEFPAPVVVVCTGHAMAGGAVLLLTADTRLGADGPFKIGLNEISIGMPLPLFVQELARDRLATAHRVAATIQATIYDPASAVEVGFLDRVVAPDELADEAMKVATELAKLPAEAHGLTKQRMRAPVADRVRATLAEDMARITPPQG